MKRCSPRPVALLAAAASAPLLFAAPPAPDTLPTGGRVTAGGNGDIFVNDAVSWSANTTLSNLWEVDDDGAYAVNLAILRRLHAGRDIALAFREGIAEVIADPRYASPYYWAPFVLFAAR